jgi:pimeloyl-ACP methyl ester carboxylesterase
VDVDHFTRDGLRFPVWDGGDPGAPAVVLLHGFPQQPSTFKRVVELLQEHGMRTLVPAERGYSATARPRGRRSYRSTETVGDVLALLDQGSLTRAHVVGHDWGGAQAWSLGAWHPDRVASLTVLSVPHPAAFAASMFTSSQGLRSSYMGFFQLPVMPEALAQLTLGRTLRNTGLPLEYVGRYCDALAEPGALGGALGWYRGIPFSLHPLAGPIQVPTTYVWGRHDFSVGRAAAHRTEAHVQAPYRFVDLDAGHWLPEAEPAAVAEAVLDRVSSVHG